MQVRRPAARDAAAWHVQLPSLMLANIHTYVYNFQIPTVCQHIWQSSARHSGVSAPVFASTSICRDPQNHLLVVQCSKFGKMCIPCQCLRILLFLSADLLKYSWERVQVRRPAARDAAARHVPLCSLINFNAQPAAKCL